MKFIKTEASALINTDYIRVVYPNTKLHPFVLIAELDNGDQYHLAEFKDEERLYKNIDNLLDYLNENGIFFAD